MMNKPNPCEDADRPIPSLNSIEACLQRIACLEKTNQELRGQLEEVNRIHLLLESLQAVLFSADPELVVLNVGPAVETILGFKPAHLQRRRMTEFVHPDDLKNVDRISIHTPSDGHRWAEFRMKAKRGGLRWMRADVIPFVVGEHCAGCMGVLTDIDDRKKTEIETVASAERYRTIIEKIQEGYFETDLNGVITFCNQALLKIAGYSREELIGRNYRTLTPPRTARALQAAFGRIYKNGQERQANNYEIFHKKGQTRTLEISASAMVNRDGQTVGFRGILWDISEEIRTLERQQRFQSQLYQAQKMEALGTLAGGLAHGFNNVLMAIQGNLSLMRMSLSADHPLQKHLERIGQSTDKGVNLAKQILSFAKMGKFVVMTTNLNKILKSTSRMFVRSKQNLRIHEFYEHDLWDTQVDRVQIGQLLLSLYMYSAETMPEGGDLYLQSENTFLDETQTGAHDLPPGRYVKISVTDSGRGLDEEARLRIFEPFYSAHRPGRHDSLGLAAVYGTVKSHKGIINVYSEKGHGTTFSIYLPALAKDTKEKPARIPESSPAMGTGTILLVDDDELSARVGRELLEHCGYRVLVAGSGSEGLEIYQELKDEINLVLLDVILPDIGGEEVLQALKKINGSVLVIVASGYSVNRQINIMLNQGCVDFIQKPYLAHTLCDKVKKAMDKLPPPPLIPHAR